MDGQLGLIQYILKSNEIFYFVCSHLIKSLSPFFYELSANIKLRSNYSFYSNSSTYFIIEQNQFKNIKKHFMFISENGTNMVTVFTGSHLFF